MASDTETMDQGENIGVIGPPSEGNTIGSGEIKVLRDTMAGLLKIRLHFPEQRLPTLIQDLILAMG